MPDPHHDGPDRGAPAPGAATGRHTIDLTNAWEPPAAAPDSVASGCPAPPGCGPNVAWVRSFGLPTGLGAGDRVWLVLDGPQDCLLALNDSPLPAVMASSSYAVEITAMLLPRNRLRLLPAAGEPPVPTESSKRLVAHGRCRLPNAYGRVRLEIDTTAASDPPQETPAGA
jgi:hypothetical protein